MAKSAVKSKSKPKLKTVATNGKTSKAKAVKKMAKCKGCDKEFEPAEGNKSTCEECSATFCPACLKKCGECNGHFCKKHTDEHTCVINEADLDKDAIDIDEEAIDEEDITPDELDEDEDIDLDDEDEDEDDEDDEEPEEDHDSTDEDRDRIV